MALSTPPQIPVKSVAIRAISAAFALHEVTQVFSGHEFHDQERGAVREIAVIENRDNRRML